MKKKFIEHSHRSLIKAITFRGVILLSDGIIIYAITKRYETTLALMVFSNIASTVLYYIHERYWNTVHWGKQTK